MRWHGPTDTEDRSVTETNVAVIVGSLRKGSLNRMTAHALAALAPEGMRLHPIEIGSLPLYDQDMDIAPPQTWQDFRDAIRGADAVLFVTPEYNRSIPGVLKNAIDVGSRPYGHSAWAGKPGAVVTVSPSAIGGFGANHHLRQCMVFLDVPMMQQPEAYVGHAAGLFGPDGQLQNESTREFLRQFMLAFGNWIDRLRPH